MEIFLRTVRTRVRSFRVNVALEKALCPTRRHSSSDNDAGIRSLLSCLLLSFSLFPPSPPFPSFLLPFIRPPWLLRHPFPFSPLTMTFHRGEENMNADEGKATSFFPRFTEKVMTRYRQFSSRFLFLRSDERILLICDGSGHDFDLFCKWNEVTRIRIEGDLNHRFNFNVANFFFFMIKLKKI